MAAEKPQQQNRSGTGGPGKRPAQVPGDAESPAKGTVSEAARKAPSHTDKTEPTRSAQDKGD